MSSTVDSLPAPGRSSVHALLKSGNILPASAWLFLVFNQAFNSPFPPSLSTVLLVLINSVTMTLFIIRRDATRVGSKAEMLIAVSAIFIVAFLKGPTARDIHWLPTAIQIIALLGWAASLTTLGRSFGIVPADRGLVQHGPYRFVRHPIYAFEALFFLGFLMAVPTLRSGLIIAVFLTLQVVRILREERILKGYGEYRQQVRWRILPGVW
jgi:protein-S-isoprenylcysteine O-methyltransferase Ste14